MVAEQGPKPTLQQKSQTQTPLVKQVLTKELQLYYEKITESMKSPDSKLQQLAIESLMQDPGIQALMPYFVTFVSDTITANLKNLHICKSMMIMTDSLFKNPHLFMEPYVLIFHSSCIKFYRQLLLALLLKIYLMTMKIISAHVDFQLIFCIRLSTISGLLITACKPE